MTEMFLDQEYVDEFAVSADYEPLRSGLSGIRVGRYSSSSLCNAALLSAMVSLGSGIATVERVMQSPEYTRNAFTRSAQAQLVSVRRMVELIQEAFSLTVKHLAQALHVERPTVYAWMRGAEPKLKAENRARLEAVYRLAERWNGYNVGPMGSRVLAPLDDGSSFAQVLAGEDLNSPVIAQAMDVIARHAKGEESPFRTRAAEAWQDKLRKRGFQEPSEEAQRLNLEDHNRHMRSSS